MRKTLNSCTRILSMLLMAALVAATNASAAAETVPLADAYGGAPIGTLVGLTIGAVGVGMAVVDRAQPDMASPPGYEVVDQVIFSEDVEAGELVAYTGNMKGRQAEVARATAGGEAHGVALLNEKAGMGGDILVHGEVDGYEGLTPGADLFLSGATDGALEDASANGSAIPVRAVTDTRIRVNFT